MGKAECWCPGLCAAESIRCLGGGLHEQLTCRAIKSTGFSCRNDLGNTSTCLERDPAGGVIQQGIECIDLMLKRREVEDAFL